VIKIHDPDHAEVYIRNGCILMHTAGSRGCSTIPALFNNCGCCYIILIGHKKNQDKNEQFNIAYDQW
jgi:hypothetical protein